MDKKRDYKARDKKTDTKDGTVSFSYKDRKSGREKARDAKAHKSKPAIGDKRKFTAGKDAQRSPYRSAGKGSAEKDGGDGASHSQVRRQKAKVSDLIRKLRINYNKLLMKKKELIQTAENKQALVKECIEMIKDKFTELIYKHDGCRIIQAMIKHGSMDQKSFIIDQIKGNLVQLMSQKYSNHLAQKAYYYAPPAQRRYFRTTINSQISKLMLHQYASEVIEYVYALTATESETQRKEMVFAFYGQYFLLLKQADESAAKPEAGKETQPLSTLKAFLEQKPQLRQQVLDKMEDVVQKMVEKGMGRHSIVQAIIADYIQSQTDKEKIRWLAETMKEKLPSLLASKQGLLVACSLFNVLDAKDRKIVVKSVQEPIKEMVTNKVASLFIVHMLNNLDDTVISKKKLIHDILLTVDDNASDKCFQNIFIGVVNPNSGRYFAQAEIEAFEANKELSTSKKDPSIRRKEVMQSFVGPLEKFYEENMQATLMDIRNHPLLIKALAARIELGGVKESDAMDELFRQIQKMNTTQDGLQILMGHPDLHRSLKELVKLDSTLPDSNLEFSTQLGQLMMKKLDDCLPTRACWILVEFLENENTKALVLQELKKNKKKIHAISSGECKTGSKGLEIITKKISES